MVSKSIVFNGHKWTVKLLGENALLLEVQGEVSTSTIHQTTALIEAQRFDYLLDLVPAYTSVALIIDPLQIDVYQAISDMENISDTSFSDIHTPKTYHIPVDYEKGLDWQEVIQKTGLSKAEIIERHCNIAYRVAMMGFLPGFIYLEGMDKTLTCPRKTNPRTRVPAGSVGIGGTQTGIYALPSPGGWQIIGQTDMTLFDPQQLPPNQLNVGDTVKFVAISS